MNRRKRNSREHERKMESRDLALLKGTEDLMAAGTDLEALEPSPETVARLAGMRLPSREAQRAVACWLGFAELPEAAALLTEMESSAGDKELKREVRRSLFRLKQRGILVPAHPGEAGEAPALAREADRGYISHVDGRGDMVVWYVRPEMSGDYYILSGVLNHRRGLLEADAGRVARAGLRDLLEGTRRRFSVRLVPADAAWCDRILYDAYKQSDSRRAPGVSRFLSFRMEITHRLPERIPCPVHALLEGEGEAGSEGALESSARLLEEPELAGWLLDSDWIDPHLDRLREITDSPLVLNRLQQEDRREKALASTLEAIFAGEAREITRRRMEAAAYFFLMDGREEAARRSLAVARALGEGSPVRPGEIALVAALVSRSVETAEKALTAQEREEQRGSLIVKPGKP